MKRFSTQTRFAPLAVTAEGFMPIQRKDGKGTKDFKTRAACEKYCKENKCIYCEEKYIFYK